VAALCTACQRDFQSVALRRSGCIDHRWTRGLASLGPVEATNAPSKGEFTKVASQVQAKALGRAHKASMRFTLHRNVPRESLDTVLPAECRGKTPRTLRKHAIYDVLAFTDSVVVSKVLTKALKKEAKSIAANRLILAARDFTIEARDLLPSGSTLICANYYGWTDARYWEISQL